MSIILSFDVSSTTLAWAVLEIDANNKINFVSADYIKPIKDGNIIERLADTRDKIKKIINDTQPTNIAIEDIISFMQGKSTANTIITLTSFNRMVGLLAHDYLGTSPKLCNVMSIRHCLKTSKVLPKKEEMAELVAKHLNIDFPYEYNKKGKQKVENEDKADAIAVGLYYAFILTGRHPKKKNKK